jgi:hypothetical protein
MLVLAQLWISFVFCRDEDISFVIMTVASGKEDGLSGGKQEGRHGENPYRRMSAHRRL